MDKPTSYLVQLLAAAMIIGGGLIITCRMVHGEHCPCGWLVVLLGAACLVIGSARPGLIQRREKKVDRHPSQK